MFQSRTERFVAAAVLILSTPIAASAQDALQKYGAYESKGFGGGVFISAICDLFSLTGGSFGGMLTAAAAMTALVAAAGGGFNSAKSALVVAVSSFGLSAGVSLYFGSFGCV